MFLKIETYFLRNKVIMLIKLIEDVLNYLNYLNPLITFLFDYLNYPNYLLLPVVKVSLLNEFQILQG